jgi:hypothetical protein
MQTGQEKRYFFVDGAAVCEQQALLQVHRRSGVTVVLQWCYSGGTVVVQ